MEKEAVSLMSDATSVNGTLDRRRWLVLGVIGLAQLMVVLDLTIMNIALPSAQRALHFTTADRQWVLTAYTLAFGSLLPPAQAEAGPARPARSGRSATVTGRTRNPAAARLFDFN
jgi:hypothetical protein